MLTDIPQTLSPEPPPLTEKPLANQTSECGIQVDLNYNPENAGGMQQGNENEQKSEGKQSVNQAQRRKMAKKLNKKRKKQKSQEMQRQARRQIGNIIQQLYERGSRFEDYSQKISCLVQLVYNNDFRDYLDQLIRMRVTYIQKDIWEYTQSILDENPFETNEDHAFYGMMVDYIYEHYLELEQSSRQIQKIINIYLKFTYQKNQHKQEIVYNNLALNTFNYMIQTDQTLRNLLHICDKKLSPQKHIQRKKLEQLIYLIDTYYQRSEKSEEDQLYSNCPNDDHMSTGLSEEDDPLFQRRKKRRKIKESQLITCEQSLSKRLEGLVVKEVDLNPCRVTEEWRTKMKLRTIKYKMS